MTELVVNEEVWRSLFWIWGWNATIFKVCYWRSCWILKFVELSKDYFKIKDLMIIGAYWLFEDNLKMTRLDEKGRLLVIWLMNLIKFVWLEDWRLLKLKFIWIMISNTKGEIVSANIIVSEIIIWENNIQVKSSQRWKSKMSKSSLIVKVKVLFVKVKVVLVIL